jgi:hypothetical protein
MDMTIVMREKFLKVTEFFMRDNFTTECAVGMNCFSEAWTKLRNYLCFFGLSCIFAGDYSAFDKGMPAIMIYYSFEVLIDICLASGNFDEDDIKIMRGIQADLCHPNVEHNGDVAMFFGGNSSGHPLTVIINSIANCIYMRMAYGNITKEPLSTFKDNVHLMVLGDDNVAGVNPAFEQFNHTTVSAFFAEKGLGYTMADKTSISVPFLHLDEIDFLKRRFMAPLKDGYPVSCPLSLDSVWKMLTVVTASSAISAEKQMAEIVLSARREWAIHGNAVFNENVCKLEQALQNSPYGDAIELFRIPQSHYSWEETIDWIYDVEFPALPSSKQKED